MATTTDASGNGAKTSELVAYLRVRNGAKAIAFYQEAFGASELNRMEMPDGKIAHAELMFGATKVMLADEFPEWQALSPLSLGGAGIGLMLTVEEVDSGYQKLMGMGCKSLMEPATQFYGYREARVIDPFGYEWTLMKQVEVLSDEEMNKRFKALFGGE